jgi:hypothetical protein
MSMVSIPDPDEVFGVDNTLELLEKRIGGGIIEQLLLRQKATAEREDTDDPVEQSVYYFEPRTRWCGASFDKHITRAAQGVVYRFTQAGYKVTTYNQDLDTSTQEGQHFRLRRKPPVVMRKDPVALTGARIREKNVANGRTLHNPSVAPK